MADGPVTTKELLGVDTSDIMRELLTRAKLYVLFEAQQIGRREPSGATAGTLLYAASLLPGISDAELRPYFEELESLISRHGSVELPAEYQVTVETNWTDAWCLAAMLQRPRLASTESINRLAASLLERQELSGGWGLRPDRPGRPHPLFCMPVTIAIRGLNRWQAERSPLVTAAATNLGSYLRRPATEPVLVRVLREAQLRLLGAPPRPAMLDELHAATWQGGDLHLQSVELGRDDQPLWYTTIDRALMIMATRHLWPVLDPVNVRLGGELLDGFEPGRGGWRNHVTDSSICTWRTAESLLAVQFLARDLNKIGATLESWRSRIEEAMTLRSTEGFDVGISFSSQQRDIAAAIRKKLREAGLTVFYDEDYQHELLGEDLTVYLHDTYFRRCRYAIAVLSADFIRSKWSGVLEWRAILTRLQEVRGNFLLPYYIDDVEVPGLSPAIGYLHMRTHSPEQFANVVIRKILGQQSRQV